MEYMFLRKNNNIYWSKQQGLFIVIWETMNETNYIFFNVMDI